MEPILVFGIILFAGFIFGEIASHLKLPKVTGYIIAGILLNPKLAKMIPQHFLDNSAVITEISLAFITFSVGGTLLIPKIRKSGKKIILITLFESELAFLSVAVGFCLLSPIFIHIPAASWATVYIPLSLILGALAAPTDPSSTLAVEHEYHAKGEVTSMIMGVAAFDDIVAIVNYSVAVAIVGILAMNTPFKFDSLFFVIASIAGAILLGVIFGIIMNVITRIISQETEGVLIVVIFSLLALCFSMANVLQVDKLLATMTMGATVVNYNVKQEMIFKMLERYTEELIFVLFFTLSSMHLDFSVLAANYFLIIIFVVLRGIGKVGGAVLGAKIAKSSAKVQKYTAGGLIPQGGIVIGLALLVKQNQGITAIADIILNTIIGATIIHELIGPVCAKLALRKAGELTEKKPTD